MSLARYLSKLGARLLSDGKVPTSALGAGAILQVVNSYASGQTTTTGTTVLAGMTKSITVNQGSSILAIVRAGVYGSNSSAWASTGRIYLFRDGSQQAISEHQGSISMSEQAHTHFISHHSGPLAAGTYNYEVKGQSTTGGSIAFNRDGAQMGQITLMEIAG